MHKISFTPSIATTNKRASLWEFNKSQTSCLPSSITKLKGCCREIWPTFLPVLLVLSLPGIHLLTYFSKNCILWKWFQKLKKPCTHQKSLFHSVSSCRRMIAGLFHLMCKELKAGSWEGKWGDAHGLHGAQELLLSVSWGYIPLRVLCSSGEFIKIINTVYCMQAFEGRLENAKEIKIPYKLHCNRYKLLFLDWKGYCSKTSMLSLSLSRVHTPWMFRELALCCE